MSKVLKQNKQVKSILYIVSSFAVLILMSSACGPSNKESDEQSEQFAGSLPVPVQTASLNTNQPTEGSPTNLPTQSPTLVSTQNPMYSPTLTGPELDATKVAPEIEARKTVDAEATNYALGTPFRTFPTITPDLDPTSTREPLATPILGMNNACVEPSMRFDYGGCWSGSYAGEYLFVAAGASINNPDLGQVQIYTATLDLYTIGALQIYSAPVLAGKLSIANVSWPKMTLVTHHERQQPDNTFTFNLLTRSWEESGPCQIYPLALHQQAAATGNGSPYLTVEYGEPIPNRVLGGSAGLLIRQVETRIPALESSSQFTIQHLYPQL